MKHAVKTGVAHNLHLVDAYRGEQQATLLDLNEEAAEAAQHAAILPSVGTEEDLTRAEDAAHAIGRHPAMVQDMEVVVPKLILHEKGHDRAYRAKEATRVADGVDREVGDDVRPLVVLAHLVARRREEGEQDLVDGKLAAYGLHQRTALLKLAERRGMKPDIASRRIDPLLKHAKGCLLATPHLAHLRVEARSNADAQLHGIHDEVVHYLL